MSKLMVEVFATTRFGKIYDVMGVEISAKLRELGVEFSPADEPCYSELTGTPEALNEALTKVMKVDAHDANVLLDDFSVPVV